MLSYQEEYFGIENEWNPLDDLLIDLPQDPILNKTYPDYYDNMEYEEIPINEY